MALRRMAVVVALVAGIAPGLVVGAGPSGADGSADGIAVTTDVVYGAAPDETGVAEALRLDLYDPTSVPGWRPALVIVHGGGFDRGDKAEPVYVATARAFAAEGFLVAAVDYRLRSDVYPDFPVASVDAQHDVQAAIRWLRAHADELRIDARRIAVTGHSAGALTALRVATHPDDPGDSGTPDQPSTVAAALAVSGFLPGAVGSATPPIRLLHGTNDTIIPLGWADDTCQRWTSAGGRCDLLTYAGGTHDATAFFDPTSPEVRSFLACTVGGGVAFADVAPGTSSARVVAWATGQGLLNGSVTGSLMANTPVSRGRFATLLWRWAGRPSVDVGVRTPAGPHVDWVITRGILRPPDDGAFATRSPMTGAEAAMALWRMAGQPAGSPAAELEGLDPSAPEAAAVDWLVASGAAGPLIGARVFHGDAPLSLLQSLRMLRRLSSGAAAGDNDALPSTCQAAGEGPSAKVSDPGRTFVR